MSSRRRVAIAVTVAHLLLSALSLVVAEGVAAGIALGFGALFFGGIALFGVALIRAASRSTHSLVSVVGVFFLGDGAVSKGDRLLFFGCAVVQAIVALVVSSIEPFSTVAFSVLVPMFGIGLAAEFGSKYGEFEPRG